jgi:HAD superfamily hydrolase (TIGR01484 family)
MKPGPRYAERSRQPLRAVYFDVDNTLVGNESPDLPSPRFIAAAHQARGRLLVGIASARPLPKVAHILTAIESTAIAILSNGAMLYDPASGREVAQWLLGPDVCQGLARALRERGIDYWVSDRGTDYYWHRDQYERRTNQWDDSVREAVPGYRPHAPAVIVAHAVPAARLGEVRAVVAECGDPSVTSLIGHEDGGCFDVLILHRQATKVAALQHSIARQGLSMGEVAFVGDGHNDTELIRSAGTGIAMGNAVPEALAVASYVVGPDSKDGAAEALETLLSGL